MNLYAMLDVYRLMFTAREIDEQEKQLVAQNLAPFYVSCTGHEAMAVLATHLQAKDWLHLHYRDKALLLARGVPIAEFFRNLLARHQSRAQGRQMSAFFSNPELKVCSMVCPVGNNALQAVGIAASIKDRQENALVICSLGDGTTQQGEVLEAIAEAVRCQLPVCFIIEDNRYSISTPTAGKTFFDLPSGPSQAFYGLDINNIDGTDVCAMDAHFKVLLTNIRQQQSPGLAVVRFERLASHTSSDDQMLYRKSEEITHIQQHCDPIANLRQLILTQNYAMDELLKLENEIRDQVKQIALSVQNEPESVATSLSKPPYPIGFDKLDENRGEVSSKRLTMREALNETLKRHLKQNPEVIIYGQDIADPKGDVFGVTKGLSTAFPDRVLNACLSESTIVGTAIGRALTGQRPVVFIQFADFIPLAFNQIISELGSMYWRSNGEWQCPVIIMATCGAYKPGLGPFHSQTMESLLAHVPGLDVFMPSAAPDAAGLLNAAFASERPTVFLYPKSCLNNLEKSTSANVEQQFVLPGTALKMFSGNDLTLVSWGYPIRFCEDIVKLFNDHDSSIELFDLRTLSPWDKTAIIASVEKTGRLVVIHEDNQTCGFGAEILATIAESVKRPVQVRRITRPDTYVPYNYANQLAILPSFKQGVATCAELLNYELKWLTPEFNNHSGESTINAIASGPADENVEVLQLLVQAGDSIKLGDTVAVVEATKSAIEICSTLSGTVEKILVKVGDIIPVNAPLISVLTDTSTVEPSNAQHQDQAEIPQLTQRVLNENKPISSIQHSVASDAIKTALPIFMSKPSCALASRAVSSEELAAQIEGWSVDDVVKRTGVNTRYWCNEEENIITLAIRACEEFFASFDSNLPINTIICSTTTPMAASPSVACQVAAHFQGHKNLSADYKAFDINAACSGFLYGLRIAYDHLQTNPQHNVLLITTETLSFLLDRNDPITAYLFGDGASATLLSSQAHKPRALQISPPVLLAKPDPNLAIHLPCFGSGQHLAMDGITIARTAYKEMGNAINLALAQNQLTINDINALVPHPGSQRILQNVAQYLNLPLTKVFSTLADTGNTSSNSIPLTLERFWNELPLGNITMAAFGAGFTSAATIAQFTGENNAQ